MLCVILSQGLETPGFLNVTVRQLLQCLKEKIPAFIFSYSEFKNEGATHTVNAIGVPIIRVAVEGSGATIHLSDPTRTLEAESLDTNVVHVVIND